MPTHKHTNQIIQKINLNYNLRKKTKPIYTNEHITKTYLSLHKLPVISAHYTPA